jgi:hypothetical protein
MMPPIGPLQGDRLKRLEFEVDQLNGEKKEIADLISTLQDAKLRHVESIS